MLKRLWKVRRHVGKHMKKVIIIFLLCIILIGGGAGAYFAFKYDILNRDKEDVINDLNKQMNVTAMFEFKAPKIKNKSEMVAPDESPRTIPMYLIDGLYYNVTVPADISIVTDYSTYIYATDMSYKVSIVRGIDATNVAGSVGMSDSIDYGNGIVITKLGTKKPQEVAKALVNDLAILAVTYDSPISYATILNGIEHETVRDYKIVNIDGDDKTQYCQSLSDIPYDPGSGTNSLLSEYKDAGAYMYRYEDGWLTEFNATQSNDVVKSSLLTRVMLASKEFAHLDRVFQSQNSSGVIFYYAEIGVHTVLCISDTINHTYACLGSGNTARQDILTYLRNVYSR